MLRTENYNLERARVFVAACFQDLADKPTQPFVSRTDWPDLEIAEQRGLAGEHLRVLEDEIETGTRPKPLDEAAQRDTIKLSNAAFP